MRYRQNTKGDILYGPPVILNKMRICCLLIGRQSFLSCLHRVHTKQTS